MRSILIGFVLTAALVSSMKVADCTFDFPEDQTSYALCDRPSVSNCLSAVPESNRLDFLEQCLLDGGCSEADAASISETIAGHCEISQKDGSWGDLKKRQKKGSSSAEPKTSNKAQTSAAPTTESVSTTDAKPTAAATTTDTPSTTDTTTDTPSSHTSASSTPSSTTPSSTVSSSTTPSTTTTSSSSTSGTALACLTTSHSSITWCVTTTGADAATGTNCIPTFTPVISCAPGLICQTQSEGDTTCMVRQDNLTTSGIVVTVIFGAIVVAFFATLLGMCIKSRRASQSQTKKREADMVAGAQAKNNAAAAQAATYNNRRMEGGSDAHLPLMAAQGPAGGDRDINVGEYRDGSRPTAHRVPSSSYQDVVASRVPVGGRGISPGMMETEADEDDMGYRGPRGGR